MFHIIHSGDAAHFGHDPKRREDAFFQFPPPFTVDTALCWLSLLTLLLLASPHSSIYSISPCLPVWLFRCHTVLLIPYTFFCFCLKRSSCNGSLSVHIQTPISTAHTNYSRTGELFCLVHPCLFFPSLSFTNRWAILMKSALPVPICVRNEFHHFFLNEGIYNETRLGRRTLLHTVTSLLWILFCFNCS